MSTNTLSDGSRTNEPPPEANDDQNEVQTYLEDLQQAGGASEGTGRGDVRVLWLVRILLLIGALIGFGAPIIRIVNFVIANVSTYLVWARTYGPAFARVAVVAYIVASLWGNAQ